MRKSDYTSPERLEDVQPLAQHFLNTFCKERQLSMKHFTESATKALKDQEWRGNARELKHFVENLAIFSDDENIDHLQVLTLQQSMNETSDSRLSTLNSQTAPSFKATTSSYEKNLILQALADCNGNISHAAEKLHIDRATLSKKIKRYGLKG